MLGIARAVVWSPERRRHVVTTNVASGLGECTLNRSL